jgi:hypothetical protein
VADDRRTADNVVPYTDQALLLALRSAGQQAVMQVVWLYEHPIDLDGVRRFHRDFGHGLAGRRIERSPLPFGRHRWIARPGPQAELAIAENARPRSEVIDWALEQVELPLDPEYGPGWRIGVQPLTDGSTAVSLVISHTLTDGGGLVISLLNTMYGNIRDLGYPPRNSRTPRQAVLGDLRQTVKDAPEIGRTLVKAAKVAARRRRELVAPASPAGSDDRPVSPPMAVATIEVTDWDERAESLGGNSFSLVAGFAGKLAQYLGRTRPGDGAVTLMLPVNEREDFEDAGGNVVAIASVSFDPGPVAKDLTAVRTAIRQGLKAAREKPDEMVELLPLIPFLPKRAMARMAEMAFGFTTDVPVSCTNMGDIPDDLRRVDGTPAEIVLFRGVDRNLSRADLERRGGGLQVASARLGGRIVLTVTSYRLGANNSASQLREVIAQTLAEFDLTAAIE